MPQGQPIRSVAVFCGSRPGHDPAYHAASVALGAGLAEAGLQLVYGGGNIGLMGAVADGVLDAGGTVLGIIPDFLQRREVAHAGVQHLTVTGTMHDRKRLMFDAAQAFGQGEELKFLQHGNGILLFITLQPAETARQLFQYFFVRKILYVMYVCWR